MPGKFRPDTVYKLCAVLGTLIVVVTPYAGWRQVLALEDKATAIFQERVITGLDLESLHAQLGLLQSALDPNGGAGQAPEPAEYTATQKQHLLGESETLTRQIEQTSAKLRRLEAAKNELIGDIKLLFAGTLLTMVAGMVIAIFGFIGWYFHLRIYPERRSTPREPDEADG